MALEVGGENGGVLSRLLCAMLDAVRGPALTVLGSVPEDVGEEDLSRLPVRRLGRNPVGVEGAQYCMREYIARVFFDDSPCPFDICLKVAGIAKLSPAQIDAIGLDIVLSLNLPEIEAVSFLSVDKIRAIGAANFISCYGQDGVGANARLFFPMTKILAIAEYLTPEQIRAIGAQALGSPFVHAAIIKELAKFPAGKITSSVVGKVLVSEVSLDLKVGQQLAKEKLEYLETPCYSQI